MTTVRAGLSSQSKTRYWRRKWKKKSCIPSSFTTAKAGRKNQNGQVPAYEGDMYLLLQACERNYIRKGKIINSTLCKSSAAKWMSHESVVWALLYISYFLLRLACPNGLRRNEPASILQKWPPATLPQPKNSLNPAYYSSTSNGFTCGLVTSDGLAGTSVKGE